MYNRIKVFYVKYEAKILSMAAKAAGAIVIAQVERVAATGTLDPQECEGAGDSGGLCMRCRASGAHYADPHHSF